MEELKKCIICDNQELTTVFSLKDYFFTQEEFTIQQCKKCGFRFTNPRPEEKDLGPYYKTENYLSHSNRNKTLFDKAYHAVKNYNLRKKRKLVEKHVSEGTIIDIGTGTGAFLAQFNETKWKRLGLEPDETARKIAKTTFGLELQDTSMLANKEIKDVTVITLWHVLEHVSKLNEQLALIHEKLASNGILVIAVPMSNSYDAKHYEKYWAAYDVPRHLYHFSQDTLQLLLKKHGFSLIEKYPMKFDSFYISLLSEQHKKNSLAHVKAVVNGLFSNIMASNKKGTYSSMIFVFKK
ncbi:MAG: class I SAM-dependent methyltransferase [Bacteroidetes bacterium]|nr:class I SAM-dependent methyltransferase [Bacteroidota bacterium]